MNKVNLPQLAQEIHEAAVAKGFWDVEDATAKHLAKMISELGEVVQADRAGVMYEVEREGAKPEGVVAELADFVMMALDYVEQCDHKPSFHTGIVQYDRDINSLVENDEIPIGSEEEFHAVAALKPVYCLIFPVAIVVSNIAMDGGPLRLIEGNVASLGYHIRTIEAWCAGNGYDLWEIIRQKMEYNKTRPALHGRAY